MRPRVLRIRTASICSSVTGIASGIAARQPIPGDFFTVELFQESLIIVCGQDRELRALLNVCRHRGSRLCTERHGHARAGAFVCPYHAWSYNLDGTLRSARHMPPDFDRTQYGLKSVHLRVIEGLIFVCLAEEPPGLEDVAAVLGRSARAHGWGEAKVAHRECYPVRANWKLVEENYMECYHCAPAHVEYSRFHLYARHEELNQDSRRAAPRAHPGARARHPGRGSLGRASPCRGRRPSTACARHSPTAR